jgi:DDE domain
MAVTVADRQFWLWRSVDDEGEVLDLLVQRRRDKAAAILASTSRNRRETLSRASPSMNSCRPLVTLLRPFRRARDHLAGQLPVPNCSHDKSVLSAYR